MSTLRTTTLQDTAGSNSVTMATVAAGVAKAWVNFNGTGTVAIRANFNISSITDNGVGDYTLNFSTALPDTNYAFCGGVRHYVDSTSYYLPVISAWQSDAKSTASIRIRAYQSNNASTDFTEVNVIIFR